MFSVMKRFSDSLEYSFIVWKSFQACGKETSHLVRRGSYPSSEDHLKQAKMAEKSQVVLGNFPGPQVVDCCCHYVKLI